MLKKTQYLFKQKILIFFLIYFSLSYAMAFAEIKDTYSFPTEQQTVRFQTLTTELRCLVCQNQTLAESGAPLANDLRRQIYKKILNGESNQKIIHYLTDRYGDFILYRPPFTFKTAALWLTPFLFFLCLSCGFFYYFLTKKKAEQNNHPCTIIEKKPV